MNKNIITTICLLFTIASVCISASELPPAYDLPINAAKYLIRPGDNLIVHFVNREIDSLVLNVNPEARIVHQTLGVFDLKGKTLEESRRILQEAIAKLYNVEQAEISISGPVLVSISIYGAVWRPGMYKSYSSNRVSDIIDSARGIKNDGSSRIISFIGLKNDIEVDLDLANFAGDMSKNPYLYSGMKIYVPGKSNDLIQVVGEVNNPKEIELKSEDNLDILLSIAGGLRGSADSANIYIIRSEQIIKNLDNIVPGDIVVVPPKIDNEEESEVAIFGAVAKPGKYKLVNNMKLDDLVSEAGGYLNDASGNLITVFRKPRFDVSGRVTSLRYPISGITSENNQLLSLELSAEDSVFVPVKVGYVQVEGEVPNPGYFPYVINKNAGFYITNAAGFLPTANTEEILFYNPVSRITSIISSGVIIPDGGKLIIQKKEVLK